MYSTARAAVQDTVAISVPQAVNPAAPAKTHDFSPDSAEKVAFEARNRRATRRTVFDKLRLSAYRLARQIDDSRAFERSVLGLAEQLPQELPDSVASEVTADECRATAIQVIEWTWPRSGTWRHPDKRHCFTVEQCRLGGQRSRPANRIGDDKRRQAIELRQAGVPRREVAQQLGISEKSVTRFCCAEQGTGTQLGGPGGDVSAVEKNNTPLPPQRVPVPSAEEEPPPTPEPAAPPPEEPPRGRPRLPSRAKRPSLPRESLIFLLRRKLNASVIPQDKAQHLRDTAPTATDDQLWDAIEWAERHIGGGVS